MNRQSLRLTRALLLGLSATFCGCLSPPTPTPAGDWRTDFERSAGKTTPRYPETVAYCRRLAEASPWIEYATFGVSPRGRDLPLLIVDRKQNFTPEAVRETGNAVVLIQACIHAGEVCGKDAGLLLVRDLTVGGKDPELLENVTLLFIPILNVDGHERFGPFNRINQNGPREMGWRTNARNLNLNRDYLKADTVEIRAWLELFTTWLPDFFVDIHSTDGADYQYAITYALETHGNLDPGVTEWTRAYAARMEEAMARRGFPLSPYVMFRRWHDPRSGLRTGAAKPRLSQGYVALQNRPGLLVEAHMLKDYPTRVAGTRHLLEETLRVLNEDYRRLRDLVQAADARTASRAFRQSPFPVEFEATEASRTVDFLGVEYEIVESDLTGGEWVRYGKAPVTYQVEFFDSIEASRSVRLPEAYILPSEWSEVIERLKSHGVELRRLTEPVRLKVRSSRLENATWGSEDLGSAAPYEGRHRCQFEETALVEEREYPAGSVVVDLAQRAARVAAHLLEPVAPDSLVHWGFFDTIFQQTEYVESYVIESLARRMLEEDPDLAEALAARREDDPDFAEDPAAIRQWFYERTPYYDDRRDVYPVGRIDKREVVDSLPLAPPAD